MNKILKLAYFAGLIDGEGNVKIYNYKAGYSRPVIKVHMTCKETVSQLHNYFGGHFGEKKIENLPNRKQQWYWAVTYKKAHEVALMLKPFSITKSQELDQIINHYKK